MAQVDFSNAVLDIRQSSSQKPMTYSDYMGMNYTPALYDAYGNIISASGASKSIITNTPSKVSILYTGTFSAGDTKFYIGYSAENTWAVSNISFSSGDTYAFVIDIEVSGNT